MTSLPNPNLDLSPADDPSPASIVLAGGCFWCVEAVYLPIEGVTGVRSGYAGGTAETANYQAVCSGTTDHAEAVEISYDPDRISLGRLLKVFFAVAHDPTQKDRQGNDRGTQYRSWIGVADDVQRKAAEESRDAYQRELTAARYGPITTEIADAGEFWYAEDYHQQYLQKNPMGYCGLGGTGVSCPTGLAG